MNARQNRFCEEYIKGASATQAYIIAGYCEKGAAQAAERLLRNVEIAARVKELQAEFTRKTEITFGWVVERTRQALDDAASMNNHYAVIRALDMLSKLHGHYNTDNQQKNPFSHLTNEGLQARLTRLCRKIGLKVERI